MASESSFTFSFSLFWPSISHMASKTVSEKAMLKHDTEKSFIFNFATLEANTIGFTLSFGDAARGCFSVYSVRST